MPTLKLNTFPNFTVSGVTFSSVEAGGIYPSYSNGQRNGEIYFSYQSCRYSINVSTSNFSSFRYEVQLLYNGTVYSTTGQLVPNTFDAGSTHNFYMTSSARLTDPFRDGRPIVLRFIIRINNAIVMQKDVSMFSYPETSKITLSGTKAQQTGKVGSLSISGLQVNSKAKLEARVCAYLRDDGSGGRTSNYWNGYINNGLTAVKNYTLTSVISGFTFYVPYYSSWVHNYNDGFVTLVFTFDISDYFTSSTETVSLQYNNFHTWSYINQVDSNNAGPIFNSKTMSENPSGLYTRYGRYVGGGIQTLTFGWNVSYRYGSSFAAVNYALYDGSTKIQEWAYTTQTNLTLNLSTTSDKTYTVIVTVGCSNGTALASLYNSFQVYGFSNPSIISFNASRCNQDGTANDSGAYCKITYQFKVTPLGNNNTKKVTLVAPDGSHVYTNLDYNHGSAYTYISAADIEHSYALSLTVQDDFKTVSIARNISTAGVIMDFLNNGKGIGLGKVAETSQMVEVNPEWIFKAQKITIKGQDLETILRSLGYVFPT